MGRQAGHPYDKIDTQAHPCTKQEIRTRVFIGVDHCSGEFVGTHAASGATRREALEPIRQGVAKHFYGSDEGAASGLPLRHDPRLELHVERLPA